MCVCVWGGGGWEGGRTDYSKIKIINTEKYTNAKQYTVAFPLSTRRTPASYESE